MCRLKRDQDTVSDQDPEQDSDKHHDSDLAQNESKILWCFICVLFTAHETDHVLFKCEKHILMNKHMLRTPHPPLRIFRDTW